MISDRYKEKYNKLIDHYKKVHVNPWHEISEDELNNLYNKLTNSMDIVDKYTFFYFMNYIIKRLSGKEDAHTKYCPVEYLPINVRIFENDILVNYPESIKGSKILSINGIDIKEIINELNEIITYGTEGRKLYELEESFYNKLALFGLPSLRGSDSLEFLIELTNGEKITYSFSKDKVYEVSKIFDIKKHLYGTIASYEIKDNILLYRHSTVHKRYEDIIKETIEKLKKEDVSNVDTIIVDLRGNTGGNSNFNDYLTDYFKQYPEKKLICLTDYRIFSGGRYALRDLIRLGAITIGEEISTPINCYGNSNWIEGLPFSSSECYFNPILGWSARSKDEFQMDLSDEVLEPIIFHPDIYVEETEEDYISGKDTILNYTIEHLDEIKDKKNRTRR